MFTKISKLLRHMPLNFPLSEFSALAFLIRSFEVLDSWSTCDHYFPPFLFYEPVYPFRVTNFDWIYCSHESPFLINSGERILSVPPYVCWTMTLCCCFIWTQCQSKSGHMPTSQCIHRIYCLCNPLPSYVLISGL